VVYDGRFFLGEYIHALRKQPTDWVKVFCMALNVLLVFFHGYDSQQLYHLEKWYVLFSYGVPAIPAITYIVLDHHGSRRMLGSATVSRFTTPQMATPNGADLVLGRKRS
jgi:hypothetical protein